MSEEKPLIISGKGYRFIFPKWFFKKALLIIVLICIFFGLNKAFFEKIHVVKFSGFPDGIRIFNTSDENEVFTNIFGSYFFSQSQITSPLIVKTNKFSDILHFEKKQLSSFFPILFEIQNTLLDRHIVNIETGLNGVFPIGVILPPTEEFYDDCYNLNGIVPLDKCIKSVSPGFSLKLGINLFKNMPDNVSPNMQFFLNEEKPFTNDSNYSAGNNAAALIEKNNVIAIIGSYNSSSTEQVIEVARKSGVPVITPSSSSSKLTKFRDQNNLAWLFRITANNHRRAEYLYNFINNQFFGFEKIAILYGKENGNDSESFVKRCKIANNHYSADQACLFYKLFNSSASNLRPYLFTFSATDSEKSNFTNIVDKLKKQNIKLAIFIGLDENILKLARAISYFKVNEKFKPIIFIPGPREVFENKNLSIYPLFSNFILLSPGYSFSNYTKWEYDKLFNRYLMDDENKHLLDIPYKISLPPDRSGRSFDSASILKKAIVNIMENKKYQERYGQNITLRLYRYILRNEINKIGHEGVSGYLAFDEKGESSISLNLLVVTKEGLVPFSNIIYKNLQKAIY
jgi:receptor family ligand binding protein